MTRHPQHQKNVGGGVILSIVREGLHLQDFRSLVLDQYGRRNWLSDHNEEMQGQHLFDKFDPVSTVVAICTEEREILAGMRIVKDSKHGFPHEVELGLSKYPKDAYYEDVTLRKVANTPRSAMAEVTKVAGKRRQRMLTKDLAKCVYWFAVDHGIEIYLSMMDMEFFLLCTSLGIPVEPIGTPIFCEGSWTIPSVLIPGNFEGGISREHPEFWDYIASRDNLDSSWGSD